MAMERGMPNRTKVGSHGRVLSDTLIDTSRSTIGSQLIFVDMPLGVD